jgi:hypothetical protein
MTDEAELRTGSDRFLARLARLHELELEKRALTPGTGPMIALAAEIEALAREVLGAAEFQHEAAREATDVPDVRPIDAIPPRDAAEVLRDWRDAERRLAEALPDTAGEALAKADIDRLRDEYRQAFELRSRV